MNIMFGNADNALKFSAAINNFLASNDTVEILGEKFIVNGLSTSCGSLYGCSEIKVTLQHIPKREFPKNPLGIEQLRYTQYLYKDLEEFVNIVLEQFVKSGKLEEYLETHDAKGYVK